MAKSILVEFLQNNSSKIFIDTMVRDYFAKNFLKFDNKRGQRQRLAAAKFAHTVYCTNTFKVFTSDCLCKLHIGMKLMNSCF